MIIQHMTYTVYDNVGFMLVNPPFLGLKIYTANSSFCYDRRASLFLLTRQSFGHNVIVNTLIRGGYVHVRF